MKTTATAEVLDLPVAYELIALVDLSARFKQIYHSGEPGTAADRTIAELSTVDAEVDHMIICADYPPYHRTKRFPEYKAHREPPSPEETYQRKLLRRAIEQRGWPLAMIEGYEADDVIATLARTYGAWCPQVLILGGDKDLAQLIRANVLQIVPASGDRQTERRDASACRKKFGVMPEHMRFWQALKGDSSDNIPGVKGIGDMRAAAIIEQLVEDGREVTPAGFVDMVAYAKQGDKWWTKVQDNWEAFVMSYELVTLDENVPVDADALLVKPPREDTMPPETDTTVRRGPIIGADPNAEQFLRDFSAKLAAEKAAAAAQPPANDVPKPKPPALVAVPSEVQTAALMRQVEKHGLVTDKLQPRDLQSTITMAQWFFRGGLYKNFNSEGALFTAIVRAVELGLPVTAVLGATHMIEGKPVFHADMIRALAERDPNCEYIMLVSADDTHATWETKHKRHPTKRTHTYTIEQARKVPKYWVKDKWGNEGNWVQRTQEMLVKTAGSQCCRLYYPGACLGLYCPEEIDGHTIDTDGELA